VYNFAGYVAFYVIENYFCDSIPQIDTHL